MTQQKSLYSLVKEHLPAGQVVIADKEFILLDRRDYHLSNISPVNIFLKEIGSKLGYPYRVLLGYIDHFATAFPLGDFNIYLSDPSMSLAAYYFFLRAGGGRSRGAIYAPTGHVNLPIQRPPFNEIAEEYIRKVRPASEVSIESGRSNHFSLILGNSKGQSQLTMAIDQFEGIRTGVCLIKDYAHVQSVDEREYLERLGLFPALTFEGHAMLVKFDSL